MGRTFVADLVSHARRLDIATHQELARLQQPYLFLVLERTHHCSRLEATMQYRRTHVYSFRERRDLQRFVVMLSDPGNGTAYPMLALSAQHAACKGDATRRRDEVIHDFLFEQPPEDGKVTRTVQKPDQSKESLQHRIPCRPDGDHRR